MASIEHRVARSTPDDEQHVNTLDVQPVPKFAVLELLDDKDSVYFRKFLKKRRWKEITPAAHIKNKTYHSIRPSAADLKEFTKIKPDWFYISGHYARTSARGDSRQLFCLPTGFFNEPFHVKEWKNAWGTTSTNTLFLQTEQLNNTQLQEYLDDMYKHWLRSPYGPEGTTTDETRMVDDIAEWSDVWEKPAADLKVHTTNAPASRGLLCANRWPDAKMVLLCGCNTHTWLKTGFHKAFPNAIVLGYINKNPANATPHISAFLKNVYKGIKDPQDPKLSDHDHIGHAWLDVYLSRKLSKSDRMVYMLPNGNVHAIGAGGKVVVAGKHDQVIRKTTSQTYLTWSGHYSLDSSTGLP